MLCLAETGSDGGILSVLLIASAVLLIAGGVLLARKRTRVALLLVPVTALALVLGAPAVPQAQAATPIPSVDIGGTGEGGNYSWWTFDELQETWWLNADLTVQAQLSTIALSELDAKHEIISVVQGPLTFTQTEEPFDTFEIADPVVTYVEPLPIVRNDDVQSAFDHFDDLDLALSTWMTWTYLDDCGELTSTTFTWTGLFLFAVD